MSTLAADQDLAIVGDVEVNARQRPAVVGAAAAGFGQAVGGRGRSSRLGAALEQVGLHRRPAEEDPPEPRQRGAGLEQPDHQGGDERDDRARPGALGYGVDREAGMDGEWGAAEVAPGHDGEPSHGVQRQAGEPSIGAWLDAESVGDGPGRGLHGRPGEDDGSGRPRGSRRANDGGDAGRQPPAAIQPRGAGVVDDGVRAEGVDHGVEPEAGQFGVDHGHGAALVPGATHGVGGLRRGQPHQQEGGFAVLGHDR